MADNAEAVLSGLFCEVCGGVFDDMIDDDAQPPGRARRCERCAPRSRRQWKIKETRRG